MSDKKQAGNPPQAQPAPNEQSGSTGRNTERDKVTQRKDTGQGTYGQTGAGGKSDAKPTEGSGRGKPELPSNPGSGRADHEAAEYHDDSVNNPVK